MKDILKLAIFTCIFSYLSELQAQTIISCSHTELCKLTKIIFSENNVKNYKFENLVAISGDPHEYEPTSSEVKNLIKADILVAGPTALNPWIKKVNYQRSKTPSVKTLSIALNKNDSLAYPLASLETLSHFWLYPRVYCALKTKLETQLVAMNFLVLNSEKKSCIPEAIKIETELEATLHSMKFPVVLTHDALLPLMEMLSKNKATVVAIKGSGHHSEATPKSVKKLYDALKAPQVIWVEEKGINISQNILSKKRKNDFLINIDTANSVESLSYFPTLYELNDKLKAIK